MAYKPLEEGYFVIKDEDQPVLVGSYSPSADKYYYPKRKLCPVTSEPVEDAELPTEGELYSWTYVEMPMMGAMPMGDQKGHGVGQIDLPCGTRIQSIIKGKQGDWEIGMKMRLVLLPVKEQGSTVKCSYCFEPVTD